MSQGSVLKSYKTEKAKQKKVNILKMYYDVSSVIIEFFLLKRISNEVHTGL